MRDSDHRNPAARFVCTNRLAVLCVVLISIAGCKTPPPSGQNYDRELPPTLDRLVAAYEDLANKRFEIIADFESPEQATIFRVEPTGSVGMVKPSADRARSETGVGSLKMSFVDSRQRIIASDTSDAKWSLIRDWSKYHLLLMSVFSPRKLGGFQVTVRSGTTSPLSYTVSRIAINPGWNLVRIDLGELVEQVNLADVREVQFGCDPLESPVDLYLDDIILTDNSRKVFGASDGTAGELYVRTEGRRLAVGAAGRFELVFARGRLREWYDLGQDAPRLRNLLGRGVMGPIPVPLVGNVGDKLDLDDRTQWAGLGIAAAVNQTVLEATPLYARVQAQVGFGSVDSPPDDSSPWHRWVYTIYRDGRVYVECTGTARGENFNPSGIGMAFTCDAGSGFRRLLAASRPADSQPEGNQSTALYALFTRPNRGSDLLVVPATPLPARSVDNASESRLGVLWELPGPSATFSFAAMMRVWPTDLDSPAQADPMGKDYQNPLPIGLEVGRLVRTDPGDFDSDGFSEGRGYYALQLDGSTARVRIPGQNRLRFSPVFKIADLGNRDLWAYIDGRQIKEIDRDADGNAFFMISDVVSRDSLLEITSRAPDADSDQAEKKK